jgi:hypothetical protein
MIMLPEAEHAHGLDVGQWEGQDSYSPACGPSDLLLSAVAIENCTPVLLLYIPALPGFKWHTKLPSERG